MGLNPWGVSGVRYIVARYGVRTAERFYYVCCMKLFKILLHRNNMHSTLYLHRNNVKRMDYIGCLSLIDPRKYPLRCTLLEKAFRIELTLFLGGTSCDARRSYLSGGRSFKIS